MSIEDQITFISGLKEAAGTKNNAKDKLQAVVNSLEDLVDANQNINDMIILIEDMFDEFGITSNKIYSDK